MPVIQCNDIAIYYETHGKGEPLVLISGLGGDSTFWESSIKTLATRFQIIVYDVRGSGYTDAREASYSIDLFANDLLALLDALHIERVNLLGFSMGGNIALAFALKYPERLSKLIIAASFATMNLQARLFLDAVLSVYESGATSKQMFDLICPWLVSGSFLSNPANIGLLQYDEGSTNPQPLYAWKNQYLAQQEFDIVSKLSEIKIPTLIIAGEQDRLSHIDDSKILADKIENAILKIVTGSGHLINYEYPDLFHQSILEFLSA